MRGGVFTAAERRAVAASCVFALAYTSRCEHALGDDSSSERGRAFRTLLAASGAELLRTS